MTTPIGYLNGSWIGTTKLAISVDDLGVTLGATVVERLRTFAGKVFRKEEHLQRLHRSLEIVGLSAAPLCSEVDGVIDEFIVRNRPLMSAGDDWGIVVFFTPGETTDAANPTVCVHGFPLPFHTWSEKYETGVDATTVDIRQVPGSCWPAEMKCRSRMHYFLADRQADSWNPGSRAILLDQDGYVCEASSANVVTYFSNRGLVTPRLSGVLPGISQHVLFELADTLGMSHSEADLLPEELGGADEVILASTSICVLPIVRLDGRDIGTGKIGPVYGDLLNAWSDEVGVDIAAQAQQFSQRG